MSVAAAVVPRLSSQVSWAYSGDFIGVDGARDFDGVRRRAAHRERLGFVDLLTNRGVDGVKLGVAGVALVLQPLTKARIRIGRLRRRVVGLRDVLAHVADEMSVEAKGHRLDQRRPIAGTCARDRGLRRLLNRATSEERRVGKG